MVLKNRKLPIKTLAGKENSREIYSTAAKNRTLPINLEEERYIRYIKNELAPLIVTIHGALDIAGSLNLAGAGNLKVVGSPGVEAIENVTSSQKV